MIIPFQIYRHFKGNLYVVLSVSLAEDTLEPVVTYMSLNGDNKVWSRKQEVFESPVPDGRENPTGQKMRFELVKDLRTPLHEASTDSLLKELKSRSDSPLHDMDIEGFNSCVKFREYVVGDVILSPTGREHLEPIVVVDSEEEARKFMENHPDRCNSRTKLFRTTYVEVSPFD